MKIKKFLSTIMSVLFKSCNVNISANIYFPEGDKKCPAIICCHGFTGVKERFFPKLASELTKSGFAVLAFDYQNRGESEGEPRGEIDPNVFVENTRDAISFMLKNERIIKERVGLFGVSFGGSIALQTAIIDRRVACTVIAGPVTDSRRWLKSLRHPHDWEKLLDDIEKDRENRSNGLPSKVIPAYDLMVPDPESLSQFKDITSSEAKRMSMMTNLKSAENLINFYPERNVDRISPRSVLLIASPNDTIVPADEAISTYEKCGQPKKIVFLPNDVSHWGVYEHPIVTENTKSWFNKFLVN